MICVLAMRSRDAVLTSCALELKCDPERASRRPHVLEYRSMTDPIVREFLLGFWKIHILHHAEEQGAAHEHDDKQQDKVEQGQHHQGSQLALESCK